MLLQKLNEAMYIDLLFVGLWVVVTLIGIIIISLLETNKSAMCTLKLMGECLF